MAPAGKAVSRPNYRFMAGIRGNATIAAGLSRKPRWRAVGLIFVPIVKNSPKIDFLSAILYIGSIIIKNS
jgi:hypothetical protein